MSKKNSKESETQPYRIFKDFLDKIVKIPEENMKKLYALFEERRLQMQNTKPEPEPEPESNPGSELESDKKSFFDNFFSGEQGTQLFESVSEKIDDSKKMGLSPANAPQHKCVIREW